MANPQSTLTFFFLVKAFCDFAFIYHILQCQSSGAVQGLNYVLYDLKGLLRPILEGVYIHFFLSASMVSIRACSP